MPSVYFGAFAGDVDAGTNSFKRWFWEHKVPRSLYTNPTEPWSEICWDPITGALFNGTAPRPDQSLYAAAAATGVELVKIDWCALGPSSPPTAGADQRASLPGAHMSRWSTAASTTLETGPTAPRTGRTALTSPRERTALGSRRRSTSASCHDTAGIWVAFLRVP